MSANNPADAKAMAYDTMWELWEARMVDLRTERDRLQRQVRELQEANINECSRRREANRELRLVTQWAASAKVWLDEHGIPNDRYAVALLKALEATCPEVVVNAAKYVTMGTTNEYRIDAPDLARIVTQAQAQGGAHE